MNTSEKAEPTASIRHIEKLSKLGIPIYNSKVPEKMGNGIQATTKSYTLQANAIKFRENKISVQVKLFQNLFAPAPLKENKIKGNKFYIN